MEKFFFRFKLTFHFKEQPPITEEQIIGMVKFQVSVELRVVVHETLGEMLELGRHRDSVQEKVWLQPLHESNEAKVGVRLLADGDQQGAGKVGHALAVAHALVVEGVGRQYVEQSGDIWISLPCEEWMLPVGPQHVLPHHVHHCFHIVGYPSLQN